MLKLYVLIRDDMSEAQQAVQAGHAVARLAQEMTTKELAEWQSDGEGTLIYLSVTDIYWWRTALVDGGFKHAAFIEPDAREYGHGRDTNLWRHQMTAIAVAPNWTCQYLLFKGLPLALQIKSSKKHWWSR